MEVFIDIVFYTLQLLTLDLFLCSLSDQSKMANKIVPGYFFSLLSELVSDDTQTDAVITSENVTVAVHSAIISNCSQLLSNLLVSTQSDTIILPGYASVLCDFITLVYTGTTTVRSEEDSQQLVLLCRQLGIDTVTVVTGNTGMTKEFNETNSVQVEVEILCENVEEKFSLRMPESRMDRRILKPRNITHSLQEFQGRIQDEFNNCPVGPYQGPYDQNPQVPLRAQLHKSNLD